MTQEEKKKYNREYYKRTRDKQMASSRKYYREHKEEALAKARQNYKASKSVAKENMKAYREAHKEEMREYMKEYRNNNKERLAEMKKEYNKIHAKEISERKKEKYRLAKDSDAFKEKRRAYYEQNKHDPSMRIRQAIRARIRSALFKKYKTTSSIELLGCTMDELRDYIESKFADGMTWENYGPARLGNKTWHLDHVIPCAAFDLADAEQQKQCFNYKNLQPLWWQDNLAKGKKLNWKPRRQLHDDIVFKSNAAYGAV